jgi:two-component system, cell cycle response regulator
MVPQRAQAGGGKILIVDDYPANIKLLQRNLESAGYETVSAADGEEALVKVAGEKPDLILLDIMLPKLDGFEVCRRLRADEATAVIPIIMITALTETEDRIRGLESGADDFISKPVDRGELLARVKSLLRIKYYRSMLSEREKFHAVIQDLSHGIIITDGQWRVQTISRRGAELLGFPSEEGLEGKDLAELFAAFQVEPSLEALRLSLTRSVTVDLTQEDVRPPKYLAGRYTRIEGGRGELYNAALVFRDVTELKRKEKLKRDVLRLFSHRLNTPLANIIGRLSLIKSGKLGDVPPALVQPIDVSLVWAQELWDLIKKVLDYANLTATEIERAGQLIPLPELVDRLRERVTSRYPDTTVEWAMNFPAEFPRARAPEELLALVIDNLMDNAVKYAGRKDVKVEISAREIEDRQLEISVRDNGPGIRSQDRDLVFSDLAESETTFTGRVGGMGFGLLTARRLVRSWGGQINFRSTPGDGSLFFFTVPSEFTPAREVPEHAGS